MSISLEFQAKTPTHPTNEISIQVDPNEYFDTYIRKEIANKTQISNKKIVFSGKSGPKEEPIIRYFPSTIKFKNKKKTFLHTIHIEESTKKPAKLEKDPSLSQHLRAKTKPSKTKKIKLSQRSECTLKSSIKQEKPRLKNSQSNLRTCESDLTRLHIYDPISNFSTEILPVSPYFVQPRPKIYRSHLFSNFERGKLKKSNSNESLTQNRNILKSRRNLKSILTHSSLIKQHELN